MWYGLLLVAFLFFEFLAPYTAVGEIGAIVHNTRVDFSQRRNRILLILLMVFLIMLCVEPMGWAPLWNGEVPGHRNQYELAADAFLKGQLHLDLPVDPGLLALNNPYDPAERDAAGVYYQWDHALYNGKYYMYFGVVPVLLVFMPYQLLTGQPLTTFHGTQIFAALFLVGLLLMFAYLAKRFFPKISLWVFCILSSAVALMSIWYCVAFPAMYCTAIMAAICLMVWSLYLFLRAVFDEEITWKTYLFAALGALCGALAFGCRPSIALGNLLVIPLLLTFPKKHKLTSVQLLCTVLCALPYVVVAAGLMWYNNARFDNPFEFGQSYQLTVADQSQYGDMLSRIDWKVLGENIKNALFRFDSGVLDYGVFVTFPILLLSVYALARKACRTYLNTVGMGLFIPVTLLTVLLIVAIDVLWSPYLLPRYTMDYLWLLGIALFVAVGSLYQRERTNSRLTLIVSLLAIFTIVVCICLFLTPYDANYANHRNLNLPWVRILLNW